MNKKKKPNAPEELRISYKIQITSTDLKSRDLTKADFESFRIKYPKLASIILSPDLIFTDPQVRDKVSKENWQTVGMQLLNALWKIKSASIFHAPVDVERFNIPDYLDLIKNPMDFGTIKVGSIEKADRQCLRKGRRLLGRRRAGLLQLPTLQRHRVRGWSHRPSDPAGI